MWVILVAVATANPCVKFMVSRNFLFPQQMANSIICVENHPAQQWKKCFSIILLPPKTFYLLTAKKTFSKLKLKATCGERSIGIFLFTYNEILRCSAYTMHVSRSYALSYVSSLQLLRKSSGSFNNVKKTFQCTVQWSLFNCNNVKCESKNVQRIISQPANDGRM